MVTPTHGIRVRSLVLVALVAGGLSWIVLRLWMSAGHLLPQASLLGLGLFVALGVGLYLAGRPVRRLVSGRATRRVHPLYAARVLALALAAALAGAATLGWYVAQVLLVLPDADVPSQQAQILQLGALGLGAVGLSAVGLLVQRMCRLDEEPPGQDDDD